MTAFRDAVDWLPWHRHPRGGDTLCDAADKAHAYENPGGAEGRYHDLILYDR